MDADLAHYRGLIYKTATLVMAYVEDDFDDVVQVLTIKVWRASLSYDPARAHGLSRDRYVFSCLTNQVKDLKKRRRRGELSLETVSRQRVFFDGELETRDRFDARYLSTSSEEVYAEVEDEPPLLPNTLDELEREIVFLLTRDFKQTEAARLLGLEKREMERAMRSIRMKLADWRPTREKMPAAVADATPVAA